MGQVHQKVGLDVGEDRTLQEPPFWHRGPGPVWQGFMYWQYSPTYIAVQLKPDTPIKLLQTQLRHAGLSTPEQSIQELRRPLYGEQSCIIQTAPLQARHCITLEHSTGHPALPHRSSCITPISQYHWTWNVPKQTLTDIISSVLR